jgi:hypothetical protein
VHVCRAGAHAGIVSPGRITGVEHAMKRLLAVAIAVILGGCATQPARMALPAGFEPGVQRTRVEGLGGGTRGRYVLQAYAGEFKRSAARLGIVTRDDGAADKAWIESGRYTVDLAGERLDAAVSLRAPYDPEGARVKC